MAQLFRTINRKTGKPHPVWRFRYIDATGRRRAGTGWPDKKKTQQHALAVEAECRAIRTGQKQAPPSWLKHRNTPIEDVIKDYLAWGNAQGGRGGRPWDGQNAKLKKKYLEAWQKRLGLKVLADIASSEVAKVVRELLEKLSAKSVSLRVEALKSLCRWALKERLIGEDPLFGITALDDRPQTPHRALNDDEVAALLMNCPDLHRTWYETALQTGYRVGELRALRCRDLDIFGPSLPLGADFTKNRKDARQPITRALADKLQKLADGRDGAGRLLGIPSSVGYKRLQDDLERAGVVPLTAEGKATWHSLRKTFVNNVCRAGADVKTIMELARHSSATMSMDVYASAKPALLRSAAEKAAEQMDQAILKAQRQTDAKRVAAGNESASANSIAEAALSGTGEDARDWGRTTFYPAIEQEVYGAIREPHGAFPNVDNGLESESGTSREHSSNSQESTASQTGAKRRPRASGVVRMFDALERLDLEHRDE